VEQGWIERFENPNEIENGRPRKEYQLTQEGRRIFEAELSRLKNVVTAAQSRISGEQA
jgi:DNA-binding PadR family transcriptional regulator